MRPLRRAAAAAGSTSSTSCSPESTTPRAQAAELAKLLDRELYKVNLIPYNPTGSSDGAAPGISREAIERFKSVLDRARIPATVRLTRGRDIAAACGQLAVQNDQIAAQTAPEVAASSLV